MLTVCEASRCLPTWFLTQAGLRRIQQSFAVKGFGIAIAPSKIRPRSRKLDGRRHQMRAAIRQQANSLPRNHLEQVLETELDLLQQRVLETAKGQFLFHLTAAAREFLLLKGTEQRYGAQRLKLAIKRHIVYPLANLLATDQIHVGDMVRIDRDHNQPCLNFVREVKDLVTPLRRLEPQVIAASVPTNIGESVEVFAV